MTTDNTTNPYAEYRARIAEAGYDPQTVETLTWLVNTAEANNWSLGDIADRVRYTRSTIGRLLTGSYGATPAAVIGSIENFRHQFKERLWIEQIPFVETSIARRIWSAIDYARSYQEIVSIIGASQWGKTTACEEYKRRKDEGAGKSTVAMIRLSVNPSPTRLVAALCRAFGMTANQPFDRAISRIKLALSPQHVLIVDEAHMVSLSSIRGLKTIETLREIYDETHCGLVLVGTQVWDKALRGETPETRGWAGYLAQTQLRGINVTLPGSLSYTDKQAIWQACGLPDPDQSDKVQSAALKMVNHLVNNYGLGRYVKRMRVAATAARKAGKTYAWPDFLAACRQLDQLAGTAA